MLVANKFLVKKSINEEEQVDSKHNKARDKLKE